MNALIITDTTAVRMNVIASRTQNLLVAGAKAMLIDMLKEKLRKGVAHFIYIKKMVKFVKHGDLSRALAEKHINGCGCSRDMFSTTAYFDIEKGAWRSLRWGQS